MDSEILSILIGAVIGLTLLALVLLRFTGNYSVYIMLGVCFVIALVIAFITSILTNWGKEHFAIDYIVQFLVIFTVPCLLAAFINYGLINGLKESGLLTVKNISIFLVLLFLLYKYATQYENYIWTTAIDKDSDKEIVSLFLFHLKNVKSFGELFTTQKNSYYDIHKIREDTYTHLFRGMPSSLNLIYYSKNENVLYGGNFDLSKDRITDAMGNGLLFPLTGKQNYNQINLILRDKGSIALEFSKDLKQIIFFEGICTPIKKSELSDYESELLNRKGIDEMLGD